MTESKDKSISKQSKKVRSPASGGIAQLGERLHGMQEVSGSIPLTSTTLLRCEVCVGDKAGKKVLKNEMKKMM